MRTQILGSVFLTCATTVAAQSADAPRSIEAVLQQWERASRDTTSIDATFTRLRINHVHERQKEVKKANLEDVFLHLIGYEYRE